MTDPNFILLYVHSAEASARFYQDLLGKAPVESSPTFAMFALESGMRLGLWNSAVVQPPATSPGGCEIIFALDSVEAVHACHRHWQQRGLPIVQAPTNMDFGVTFVATDPDGHRLRVLVPAPGQA